MTKMASHHTVKTSWTSQGDIDSLLGHYENEENEESTSMSEDELSPIVFSRPEKDSDSCVLYLKSCPGKTVSVKYVEILSDRKTVEIYHRSEGYMFCMRGQSVASDEGEIIYSCSSKLDFTCDNISLKFPAKIDVDAIKLYKIKLNISIVDKEDSPSFGRTIDLEKVKDYLGDIPESAKGLYNSMEAYQKNQQSMTAAMSAGSGMNMGGLGMMGLMSALMGNLNMSPSVRLSNSPKLEHTKIQEKVINDSDGQSSTEIESVTADNISDDVGTPCRKEENGEKTKCDPPQTLPQKSRLSNLLNGVESGQSDSGMFSMLKEICSTVSKQRDTPQEDTVLISEKKKEKEEKATLEDESVGSVIEEQLQKTEERLKLYVDKQLTELEERLNERLDKILTCTCKKDDVLKIEETLKSDLTKQLSELEYRMNEKFDKILNFVSKSEDIKPP
ncbi:Hypothetical predicted protein [Mytilus galloprovincialis]|uniref:Uncharacterized protein n=1 Tax=Mytilus galloprovincialis TaxID=29158 RepID=A0A8B6FPR2_MYTGA|nr:Hypothetical predicted protein [Mytilus galloprovincialis]